MKRKWAKRLLLVIVLGLLAALGTVVYGFHMARSSPAWYHGLRSESEEKDAANRADQKFAQLFSWAADVQAQNLRRKVGRANRRETPVRPLTFSINDDELNSFIRTWPSPQRAQLASNLSKYFTDGRIGLEPGQIIIAGQSTDYGALTSASFSPSLDAQGRLNLKLEQIAAGRLPLPRGLVDGQLDRLKTFLQGRVSDWSQSARLDNTLAANGPAGAAGMTNLLVQSLSDQPSPAVLFIPFDLQNLGRTLPVSLTDVRVDEGTLTLTLAPMTGDQEAEALKEIQSGKP